MTIASLCVFCGCGEQPSSAESVVLSERSIELISQVEGLSGLCTNRAFRVAEFADRVGREVLAVSNATEQAALVGRLERALGAVDLACVEMDDWAQLCDSVERTYCALTEAETERLGDGKAKLDMWFRQADLYERLARQSAAEVKRQGRCPGLRHSLAFGGGHVEPHPESRIREYVLRSYADLLLDSERGVIARYYESCSPQDKVDLAERIRKVIGRYPWWHKSETRGN